jgi:protein-S-isoprenylcysteine O-methyltransferase Ste14
MSGWPVRRLVALYPRAWRERYGGEVADLTDELISEGRTTRLRAGLELAEGAVAEHGRVLARSPAAALGGVAALTAGAGIGLRGWSFAALGRYSSYGIVVSPAQPVVATGPYRRLRHPSYTGGLLICGGAGLMSANWAGVAAMTLLPLAVTVWRIRLEETALLAGLGERYRAYASDRRRLVPLIW